MENKEEKTLSKLTDEQLDMVNGGLDAFARLSCPKCHSLQIVRVSGGFKCLDCGHIF